MSSLVSILTPSFNQARWLGDNLRSVSGQTYKNVEHIVMDGGSSDGSIDILKRTGGGVRWRSEPDKGQSHALNKAFAECRGEVIGWLNSDDAYFDSHAVSTAVRLFQRRPDVDVIYGHAALVNAEGLILQMVWAPPFNYRLLRAHNFIIQPTAFIRRAALGDFLADESYDHSMDRELWLRLGRRHRFMRANRVLAIDRYQSGRKTITRPDLARADLERLVAAYSVPQGRPYRMARKVVKVVLRLMGLRIVPYATSPLSFDGRCDALWRLAVRQSMVPRAAMSMG